MPKLPERPTVLIVDDTPENLTVLGELLQHRYRVRVASTGQRALQVAAGVPRPDLILLDVMMPGMDGYAVIRELRAHPDTRGIPVIFVTAMDGDADEERGLELGAVDYITKPIRPAIVLARVNAQMELKQARDWLQDKNLWLESEIARRMRDNQLMQDVSIRALASLAEARDMETGQHIRRTQSYVEVLVEHLRPHPRFAAFLTDTMALMVGKAAPLHDIGKVGIPDSILLKPARLSVDEFEIMKTHSAIGGDAIDLAMRSELSDADYQVLQQHCQLGSLALEAAVDEF
jgi:putative two-component system response regulator